MTISIRPTNAVESLTLELSDGLVRLRVNWGSDYKPSEAFIPLKELVTKVLSSESPNILFNEESTKLKRAARIPASDGYVAKLMIFFSTPGTYDPNFVTISFDEFRSAMELFSKNKDQAAA